VDSGGRLMDRRATRLFMTACALVTGALGVVCLYMPDLVLVRVSAPESRGLKLAIQLLGTLYLSLAFLNWMWRGNQIGGIYGRPVLVANLMHFFGGALVMGVALSSAPDLQALWPLVAVYGVLTLGFLVMMFRSPSPGA
jgi:hypothetical protein